MSNKERLFNLFEQKQPVSNCFFSLILIWLFKYGYSAYKPTEISKQIIESLESPSWTSSEQPAILERRLSYYPLQSQSDWGKKHWTPGGS